MDNKSRRYRAIAFRYLARCLSSISALLGIAVIGCTDDSYFGEGNTIMVDVLITLNIPDVTTYVRSATIADEKSVDNITAFVFDKNDNLAYRAIISHNKANQTVSVKMKRSAAGDDTDLYSVMFIANFDPGTFNIGDSESAIQAALIFDCNGKWDAAVNEIPMWGKTEKRVITPDVEFDQVDMLRALARIDVGLNFSSTVNGSESVSGISGYSLTSVYLFNTLTKGCVMPVSGYTSDGSVTDPSIPSGSTDTNPMFGLANVSGNKVIREFYIAENSAEGISGNNPVFLVVGIQYKDDEPSYYRIDITNTNSTTGIPILRNHRYIFDIKSITGKGFQSITEAMHSSSANIEWELIVDAGMVGVYISGNKYFTISSHKVWITGYAGNSASISYTTNIPETELVFEWENSIQTVFTDPVSYTYNTISAGKAGGNITLTSIGDNNDPDNTKMEQLRIATGAIADFAITVIQNIKNPDPGIVPEEPIIIGNPDYSIVPGETIVNGIYLPPIYHADADGIKSSTPIGTFPLLNNVHSVSILLKSHIRNQLHLSSDEYEISTAEIDGFGFYGTGAFPSTYDTVGDTLFYRVTLQGTGNPTTPGYKNFTLSANNMRRQPCHFKVLVGYREKKILTYSSYQGTYGYATESGSSRLMMESAHNFGLRPTSIVPIEGFENTHLPRTSGTIINGSHPLIATLTGPDKPDIVILGYNFFTGPSANTLKNFVDQGGVIIFLDDNAGNNDANANINTYRLLFGNGLLQSRAAAGAGTLYSFVNTDTNDPIMNGPFGNLIGKRWGEDASITQAISGTLVNTVIYSQHTNGVTICRHNATGVFFVGDGGFISSPSNIATLGKLQHYSITSYPFAVTSATYKPAPRDGYNNTGQQVYNSQLFANVIYWAIDYAEFKGINSSISITDYALWGKN